MLRITRIETTVVDHPLRSERVITSALGRHTRSRFLTVAVHGTGDSGESRAGFGEAATTTLWSGETADTAQHIIRYVLAPKLEGATFAHPREALQVMDRLTVGNPFAKGALDTALWDLWARSQNRSVSSLIADREPLAALPTRVSIAAAPPRKTVALCREFWGMGIRTLKFKIGVEGIDDVARLRAVRKELGSEPVFTVDANAAYADAEQALAAIEPLLTFDLVLVEQPTPRHRLSALAAVRRRIQVPVMADEAVFEPAQLAEAIELDAFDILSVYPGKNGGFSHTLEMVAAVQRAGKTCAIGSNLETELGLAAMATLAAALTTFDAERVAGDFASSVYYERSSLRTPLPLVEGRFTVPSGAGFGVQPAGGASGDPPASRQA